MILDNFDAAMPLVFNLRAVRRSRAALADAVGDSAILSASLMAAGHEIPVQNFNLSGQTLADLATFYADLEASLVDQLTTLGIEA